MNRIELYEESFKRKGNKPKFRPQNEASLLEDNVYGQLFRTTRIEPSIEHSSWEQFGEDLDGDSNRGELGHTISLSYDGKLMATCGSVHAHLYKMYAGEWELVRDFSRDLDTGRGYYSVSLSSSGNRIAIGAPNNDEQGSDSGYIKAFEKLSNWEWVQVGRTLHGRAGDLFGNAMALSEDGGILVIGAYGGGYVQVLEYSMNTKRWVSIHQFVGSASDGFGFSVAVSGAGDRVLIGAPWGTDGRGFIRMYDIINFDFVVEFDGDYFDDQFGFSVSLSLNGMRAASGAFGASYVRVFDYVQSENRWDRLGYDIRYDDSNYALGESISLSEDGEMIAVGAPWGDYSGPLSGQSDLFMFMNNEWINVGPTLYGGKINDLFGRAVSLSGNGKKLAIGCPGCDSTGYNTGKIMVFHVPLASTYDDDDTAPSISPAPSVSPSAFPTKSSSPSVSPSKIPSTFPTISPTFDSSNVPSLSPTSYISTIPTTISSISPSKFPTRSPTSTPSEFPSVTPSLLPSKIPSMSPIGIPSSSPLQDVFMNDDNFVVSGNSLVANSLRNFFYFFYRSGEGGPSTLIGIAQTMRYFAWWLTSAYYAFIWWITPTYYTTNESG